MHNMMFTVEMRKYISAISPEDPESESGMCRHIPPQSNEISINYDLLTLL